MPDDDTIEAEVLERGDIFFLYRPRVEEEHPSSLADVQRFFIVLGPEGGKKLRLLAVGRKRLPDVGEHERFWGFVDTVTDSAERLAAELRRGTYMTKTRGKRHRPAARPVGEGAYAITLEDAQMHLYYALQLPEKTGEVQKAFNIAPEASFALSIKNPEASSPAGVGLPETEKAQYPDKLQEEFRDRRFAREDVRLLDVDNAEFILIGARTDPERAYDLDLESAKTAHPRAKAIAGLHLPRTETPIKPMFEGVWE
jgi:hypothetical protein